jgi:hypothetical protein
MTTSLREATKIVVTKHMAFSVCPIVEPRWLAWPVALVMTANLLARYGLVSWWHWRRHKCGAIEECTFLVLEVNGRRLRIGKRR